jgi:chromosome segregation ATPase
MAHFLKRLELNGFKSFADKVVLEFPVGITAVVGPNGSGKSNIVDAIRWLLGEREAKNLRGAKVEDLIFAGTSKRSRVGQAQASLHFENKNNFFPVDFAEVSVLRQISRDGVSRYFLNKSEILLRDLIDFFAKARLGSRGLIVVTQGNSDVFVQASPTGRREMIEEILGLREYKIKRIDAEHRLKNSQVNLDKARALIDEILPHLRSLKRQTSRWEKRGFLENELKDLENKFFGSQLREIKEKTQEVIKKINDSQAEFSALKKIKEDAELEQARVEASQSSEHKDLRVINEQIQAVIEKRNLLQKELGRLEAQLEMGRESQTPRQTHSIQKLVDLIGKIKNKLESVLDESADKIKKTIKEIIAEIESVVSGSAKQTSGELNLDVKTQFDKTNHALSLLERELASLKEKEAKLEQGQEQFYKSFKIAVAAVETAKENIEKWEARHREYLFEKERLDFKRGEIERQIMQAGRNPSEFKDAEFSVSPADLPELERRIFKLRGDLASIGEVDEVLVKEARETDSRYQFLKKESEDLEKAVSDLKKLIKELSYKIETEFNKSMGRINEEFGKFFALMFDGGRAKLKIEKLKIKDEKLEGDSEESTSGESPSDKNEADKNEAVEEEVAEEEGGVEIEVRLPRKKINSLEMLSGGERSLVGIAALFALISVSPPPFLVLDEIDAALDERNAKRFADMLKEFSKKTQFIIITHNRATMEVADVLYGVTLAEDGTSKILSLKLESG